MLRDEQVIATHDVLLGRVIAAVRAVATEYFFEDPLTLGHGERLAFAQRALLQAGARNYGRAVLEMAAARFPGLQPDSLTDEQVLTFVRDVLARFAASSW